MQANECRRSVGWWIDLYMSRIWSRATDHQTEVFANILGNLRRRNAQSVLRMRTCVANDLANDLHTNHLLNHSLQTSSRKNDCPLWHSRILLRLDRKDHYTGHTSRISKTSNAIGRKSANKRRRTAHFRLNVWVGYHLALDDIEAKLIHAVEEFNRIRNRFKRRFLFIYLSYTVK